MALILYYHPLSSYCWKVLIALYENATPFAPRMIDLGDAADRETLHIVWPMLRFPVLEDRARGVVVPETSIIIDYLQHYYPGPFKAIPADFEAALEVRLMDRLFDGDVMDRMGRIVGDRLRPDAAKDPHGVATEQSRLAAAYAMIEKRMAGRPWAAGDTFTMADCAAAPALFYADKVAPFRTAYPALGAYLARLEARPSVARVLAEAQPYFSMFPG